MYSQVQFTSDGVTQQYGISFSYIKKEDVTVYVNGVSVPFTWVSSSIVNITSIPAAGATILIKRSTSLAAPLVNFAEGSILSADNLDMSALQSLYITQELYDSTATNTSGSFAVTDTSGANLTFTNVTGKYVKVGNLVNVGVSFTYPTTSSSATAKISLNSFLPDNYSAATGVYDTTPVTVSVSKGGLGIDIPKLNSVLSGKTVSFQISFMVA